MGLLDKVKGILFDEEEIEIPEIKKEPKIKGNNINRNINKIIEPIEQEDKNPIKELKVPKDDFKDSEYKSESTFTFPIDFDDEPIEPKIEEKPRVRNTEYRQQRRNDVPTSRDFSDFLSKRDEKKKFKPTPIISPVYGVLDQNYKKEDVIVKKEVLRETDVSLDQVRKKAFGSLEDELEQNLTNTKEIKLPKKTTIKKNEKVEKPVDKLKTIGELIEEDDLSLEVPEIESIKEDKTTYNSDSVNEKVEIKPKNKIEDLISEEDNNVDEIDDEEADLFSLIDSMYEEKGE